jgi:hypothetical protein
MAPLQSNYAVSSARPLARTSNMESELGSQVDTGFYSFAPSMVLVNGWPQKRSNELNIALVVRVKRLATGEKE